MHFKKRFWEIDFLRGIAVIMMIVFHFLFDMTFFRVQYTDMWAGFWFIFGRITALIFIFLVGVSLTLSYSRAKYEKINLPLKYIKRGVKIFCLGLLITAATLLFLKDGTIVFGVLHFIGIAIILAYPLIKYRYANLVSGLILIAAGIYLSSMTFNFNWLLWLGFNPSNFYTFDYFPLLPWFGVVLLGIFVGNALYRNYRRSFKLKEISIFPIRQLCFVGRHSLIIYFIHQPILIGLLYFLRVF